MKKYIILVSLFAITSIVAQDKIKIEINPHIIENRIDKKLYGFLLEHIYHSVSNGLWGENVWNRSFEELQAYGDWSIDHNGQIELNAANGSADFRIANGADFEMSLEFKINSGVGNLLIGVRDQNRERMLTNRIYWYLNANGNSRLEENTGWIWHTPITRCTTTEFEKSESFYGRWTKLKIRCAGNIISGSLNNTKVFEKEIDNCPRNGNITLGGANCTISFRNIKIVNLDGNTIKFNLNPCRHWDQIGTGRIKADTNDALNHNTSLAIISTGKYCGIEQPQNYSVYKDDVLCGNLYLKGDIDKVRVQLVHNKKIISQREILNINRKWECHTVSLPVNNDYSNVSLQIIGIGKGELKIDQVSLMQQSSIDNGGFRKTLTQAAAELYPTTLRWPGGSFSEHYHFEDGLGSQTQRKGIQRWDDFDPLSFGTDEYIAFCRKVGAEPIIVLPIGYHNYDGYSPDRKGKEDWLQRTLDWIEYCNGDTSTVWGRKRAENGHTSPYNVKYWEIDNEVWKMDPNLYAELTRIFSIEIKKRYPDTKIIGCGCGRLGKEGVGLDSIMIHTVAEYIDYISPHYYQTINKYGNDGVEEYGRYLDKLSKWITQSKNSNMKIYLSEWNLEGTDMRTGLFTGGFLNRLESTPSVEMAASALYLRHISAPAWDNAFINFDNDSWFPAPNYVVFKLWREYFLPLRVAIEGDTKELNVIATRSEDGTRTCLKIVNPSDKPYTFSVKNGASLGNPFLKEIVAENLTSRNDMQHREIIKATNGKTETLGNDIMITVQAYSASILSFRCN